MADMIHQVTIAASPEKVFQALTTQEGLKSWWTSDTEAEPRVGSTALFGFDKRSVVFKMNVDELAPKKRVRWSCVDGPAEWKGTKLRFDLESDDEGGTTVRFVHSGWRKTGDMFGICNTTWGALMVRLKAYVEGENPGPFFVD
ncbi:MAG: SRPBCC domain-containing protein [Acidobacteria bacterium]|nr:SRPBCC domain-containing protein [Acidobacteriota bacterium]